MWSAEGVGGRGADQRWGSGWVWDPSRWLSYRAAGMTGTGRQCPRHGRAGLPQRSTCASGVHQSDGRGRLQVCDWGPCGNPATVSSSKATALPDPSYVESAPPCVRAVRFLNSTTMTTQSEAVQDPAQCLVTAHSALNVVCSEHNDGGREPTDGGWGRTDDGLNDSRRRLGANQRGSGSTCFDKAAENSGCTEKRPALRQWSMSTHTLIHGPTRPHVRRPPSPPA